MAKKKFNLFFAGFFSFILGFILCFSAVTYFYLPLTDEVTTCEEIFYTKNENIVTSDISVESANMSVHFLELGNKYTGDCTYIKTDTCDILIDCGSKSNSVGYVSEYLKKYVTDGVLEYVIITHAHQDHYAGFATPENVPSIFDLFQCNNIITFSKTNQSSSSKTYQNYLRGLNKEINEDKAKHYTSAQCIKQENGAKRQYNIGTDITLEILDSFYYYNVDSRTENNYSVCSLITYKDGTSKEKNLLFTGDLEKDGEEELIKKNPELPKVDLYKAGHHGSKTSSSEALLSVIQPKTVCICCCAGSPEYTKNANNQFPTQEFINRIAKYTNEIYVTTLCVDYQNNKFTSFNGNIVYMITTTHTYQVKCSNNNTILKESEWFKQNRTWPKVAWHGKLNICWRVFQSPPVCSVT